MNSVIETDLEVILNLSLKILSIKKSSKYILTYMKYFC